MSRYLFDLEADGLLDTITKIHSIVLKNIDTGEVTSCAANDNTEVANDNQPLQHGLEMLKSADLIIGHNIIKYDIPAIQKVHPELSWAPKVHQVFDTLVASRLIWTNLQDLDWLKIRAKKTELLPKQAGSHSLDAWGKRLGCHKGDYAKTMEEQGLDPWASWTPLMQDYCEQDVEVTGKLYALIVSKGYSQQSLDLEMAVAWIIAEQERTGFAFDTEKAKELYSKLVGKRVKLESKLQEAFPPWEIRTPFTPKVNNKTRGYVKGVPTFKVKPMVFNPGSRHHIADRLQEQRGWKPKAFTDSGQPKVDESVLTSLPYPEAKLMADYLMVQKRIAMIAEGPNSWLERVQVNERIHGGVNTNGAATGRATHSRPNVAQTTSVQTEKVDGKDVPIKGHRGGYGFESRELWTVTNEDQRLVGVDVSGLELRMLGHYLAAYDGGAYGRIVVDGDVHTSNQQMAGLPTRSLAKVFIYLTVYGGSAKALAKAMGITVSEARRAQNRFMRANPAFKKLVDDIKAFSDKRGHVPGLDGRRIITRSPHSALNFLLQGGGAIVCKQWMVEFHKRLADEGLSGTVKQVAWVHDELQMECPKDLAQTVGRISVEAIVSAGETLGLKVPLTGEFNIGNNWAETH